ncbi:lipopolysaccharide biosynthesis protein [Geitlerinema sp. PCC 7407]|nr:lipopolysaccharide biosynthesis protein [Geitlerinema sp. PCC 7407]
MSRDSSYQSSSDDEISLADIIRFFLRNLTLIGLITIGFTGLALVYSLTRPANYQQKSVLAIQANPIKLADRTFPAENTANLNNLVISALNNQDNLSIQASSTFDAGTQQLTVTATGTKAEALKSFSTSLPTFIQDTLQSHLNKQVLATITAADIEQSRANEALAQLNQQINTIGPSLNNSSIAAIARLNALEEQRAILTTNLALRQADSRYLDEAKASPQAFIDKVVSISVLAQSEVEKLGFQKRSIVLIAITSFIMAVLVAIVREQLVLIGNADAQKTLAAPQSELEDLEESRQP